MKAVMLMFDTLNRRFLPPYGCDWTVMPNFQRLAERTVTFENSYAGSLPCMPARRELHTGRYNFLHRSWGPLEPFDDSLPRILHENGVHTHLASDHYHYWEDGGATYHTRYSSWQFHRGQEYDLWMGQADEPPVPEHLGQYRAQHDINRQFMQREEDQPQPKTFADGLDYIRRNKSAENWFLHLETFDPHEPYFCPQKYMDLYPHDYDGPRFDWPCYRGVTEEPEAVQHCRYICAALHSMCDHYLGKALDLMDELDLWRDTMLIVNTDHGFLMGEHELWAKCHAPFYNEVAHTPLFVYDPRCGRQNERRQSLVQTVDLAPTLLEYFGIERPADMQGAALRQTVAEDAPVREAGLFGLHGGHVNVTDGRYVYMRAPKSEENGPLYNYTLMPTNMRGFFGLDELAEAEIAPPRAFTKGARVMKIPARRPWGSTAHQYGSMLFDLENDPAQENPIRDAEVEARLTRQMVALMRANDAPPEQFERLGLQA